MTVIIVFGSDGDGPSGVVRLGRQNLVPRGTVTGRLPADEGGKSGRRGAQRLNRRRVGPTNDDVEVPLAVAIEDFSLRRDGAPLSSTDGETRHLVRADLMRRFGAENDFAARHLETGVVAFSLTVLRRIQLKREIGVVGDDDVAAMRRAAGGDAFVPHRWLDSISSLEATVSVFVFQLIFQCLNSD